MPNKEISQTDNLELPADSELEKKITERIHEVRDNMRKVFDMAREEGVSPVQKLVDDTGNAEGARYVHGDEAVDGFLDKVENMTFETREEFVDMVVGYGEHLIRARFENPEVQKRIDDYEAMNKRESVQIGKLLAEIHVPEWNFSIGDTEVTRQNKVLEIQWPEKGEAPGGIEDIKESFREISKILKEDESIKAVIGVSWMMSHPVTKRLGFHTVPGIDIPDDRVQSILDLATNARKDKPYKREVGKHDVVVGAMSRDDFIRTYD